MKQSILTVRPLLAIALFCLATSCEKPVIEGGSSQNKEANNDNVTITFSSFTAEQKGFGSGDTSRAAEAIPIADVATRINLAIFDADSGERAASVNQERSDATFGKITVRLPKGEYAVVAIAHNGDGNATISSPSKVTFKNNKVTDTFCYYGTIDASADSQYGMDMRRAVAMFRLTVKDYTPKDINAMKFYYTGGSSTLDATTGRGCVNSKQTEIRTVSSDAHTSESSYDIFTFPHDESGKLKIEVSALESPTSTSSVHTRTFSDVDITRNHITHMSGFFYGEDQEGGRSFSMTTTDEWVYDNYTY